MKINNTVKTKDGIYTFTGELDQQELDLIIEAGLAILLQHGVLSVTGAQEAPDETQTIN